MSWLADIRMSDFRQNLTFCCLTGLSCPVSIYSLETCLQLYTCPAMAGRHQSCHLARYARSVISGRTCHSMSCPVSIHSLETWWLDMPKRQFSSFSCFCCPDSTCHTASKPVVQTCLDRWRGSDPLRRGPRGVPSIRHYMSWQQCFLTWNCRNGGPGKVEFLVLPKRIFVFPPLLHCPHHQKQGRFLA